MSLQTMPNGEVVDIADDTPPDVVAKIKSQFPATRASKVAAGQPRVATPPDPDQAEVDKRVKASKVVDPLAGTTFGDFNRNVQNLGGLAPLVGNAFSAGTFGVYNAIKKGDIGEIGKEYNISARVQNELNRQSADNSPVASFAGDVGGSLLVPIGGEGKLLAKGGEALTGLGAERLGGATSRVAARLAKGGPISKAIVAGAEGGAINAAGRTENIGDLPGNALLGGGVGGFTGGALGGTLHLGARGVQILKDAAPGNAVNTAYQRIAQLLDNGGLTADKARSEITNTDIGGGNALVQDLTPGLRAQAASISRKPSVPSSNDLIETGESRIAARRENFGQQVRDTSGISDDGLDRLDEITGTRRQAGQADYVKGGAMDAPLNWTPELDNFFRNAPPITDDALKSAYTDMLNRRENPATMLKPDGTPLGSENGKIDYVPNMRTFDYTKRAFDTKIGQALKTGNKSDAQALSEELTSIKGLLGEANPQYRQILATQRDLFQKQNALETGQKVLQQLPTKPRETLRALQQLPDHAKMDARIGMIDALVNSDTKADPVNFYKSVTRNDAQKKVMEFAFGGPDEFNSFNKWIDREVRSQRADVLTAPGRQSETSRINMADDDTEHATNVLHDAMRGFAFGGPVGAMSGVVRRLGNIASGTGKYAQEEIAKILLSKGEGLNEGVRAANSRLEARKAGNVRRAVGASRVGSQFFTNPLGGS